MEEAIVGDSVTGMVLATAMAFLGDLDMAGGVILTGGTTPLLFLLPLLSLLLFLLRSLLLWELWGTAGPSTTGDSTGRTGTTATFFLAILSGSGGLLPLRQRLPCGLAESGAAQTQCASTSDIGRSNIPLKVRIKIRMLSVVTH